MEMYEFPKLPDQDQFLLDLQNNNYSMLTVFNYARDLSIFAVFLKYQSVKFTEVDKRLITIYKGYLRNGDHLKDLNKFREDIAINAGTKVISAATRSDGSKTRETDLGGISTPDDRLVSTESSPQVGRGIYSTGTYLDNVYRKVFGSLGVIESRTRRTKSNGDSGLDVRSVNRMLSAIRSYLKYRIDMDLDIPLAPDGIKLVKADRKKSQVAELDQLISLIEAPMHFERDRKAALRNRCMLEMLFASGMRISELIGLNLDQVNLDGKLFITGKGKKQRFVYLTPRAMLWLNRYLAVRLRFLTNDGSVSTASDPVLTDMLLAGTEQPALTVAGETSDVDVSREGEGETVKSIDLVEDFETFNPKEDDARYVRLVERLRSSGFLSKYQSPALFIPFSGGRNGKRGLRLSSNFFQEKIANYRRRLGIAVPTSAHSLRHGFATYLAENGASPAAIQILLGHESLNTTTRYVHASDKFAQETHQGKHPLSK